MPPEIERFAGTTPYASELLGVYQPLLGWKGARSSRRVARETDRFAAEIVDGMVGDARVQALLGDRLRPLGTGAPVAPRTPGWLTGAVGTALSARLGAFVRERGRLPQAAEWRALVKVLDPGDGDAAGDGHARAAVLAGVVEELAGRPEVLARIFGRRAPWERLARFLDPLAEYDPETRQAVLSPVGVLEVYRQYFFEFSTFLGPPVGHVWVSPGGSLEVYEVHTRRSVEERQVELGVTSSTRSETEAVEQDELSTAVSTQNARNTNLGVSSSTGVNFGVVQSSASVNVGLALARTTAEQTAHRHSRQQSDRIANEIRRDLKVTYRTSVELTDTSSRRYVLQNTTDRIVNIELRRKMRRVGVQLQHVGTQLCWQVYADEPGTELGIAELVHVAAPGDADTALQPPDAPVLLEPKETEQTVTFPFEEFTGIGGTGDVYHGVPAARSALYRANAEFRALVEARGIDVLGESSHGLFGTATIRAHREFDALEPGPGYTLRSVEILNADDRVDGEREVPVVAAEAAPVRRRGNRFSIRLDQVDFNDQPAIRFNLALVWDPPDQADVLTEYEGKLAEYTEREQQLAHQRFVGAVRDRLRAAGSVRRRPAEDLRAEERTVVYRRLLRQLTQVGDPETPHITAELIRAIFDVDSLMYFVAPEWWRPKRRRYVQQVGQADGALSPTGEPTGAPRGTDGDATRLTARDTIGWGGARAAGRDNYLITEETEPAPLGASLGWLLQLDGDEHRNAFLNSPWVKAVIPIRPGRETAALRWLELAHVEGADGLDEPYAGTEPALRGRTVREALDALAGEVAAQGAAPEALTATETVFEHGFDPLDGGFRAATGAFAVFDQWTEVLPTDQTVAVDYDPDTDGSDT